MILLFLLPFLNGWAQAQDLPKWDIGVKWSVWVLDDDFKGYPNTDVEVQIMYKDKDGNEVYHETQSGTTNDASHLVFTVGNGTDSSGILTPADFVEIRKLCYTIEFEAEGEVQTITGEQEVGSASRANAAGWAAEADTSDFSLKAGFSFDSEKFSGFALGEEVSFEQLALGLDTSNIPVLIGNEMRPFALSHLGTFKEVTKTASNETTPIFYSQWGGLIPKFCGPEMPDEVENMYTTHIPVLDGFFHGMGVYVDETTMPGITAAVYFRNIAEDGLGGIADGSRTGFVTRGVDGLNGISLSGSSGAGVYGYPFEEPAKDQVKVGLLGSSNGFGDTWAVFGNGPSGGLSAWSNVSDRRLKKNIRNASDLLEKVLQLTPRNYEFIQQDRRDVPAGNQLGFVAQEVEMIFPEIVTNIPVPELTGTYPYTKIEASEYKGIQYASLVPALAGAIQELNQKVEEQQDEIDSLKAQMDVLLKMINEKE